MIYKDEAMDWLMEAKEKLVPKIENSDLFVSLFTPGYKKDPKCAIELGMSILMEKPLLFFVPNGELIPRTLKLIADKIVFYDPSISPDDFGRMAMLEIEAFKISGGSK